MNTKKPYTEIELEIIHKYLKRHFGLLKICKELMKVSYNGKASTTKLREYLRVNGLSTGLAQDVLIREKKDSSKNIDVDLTIDATDITKRSMQLANKHSRTMEFETYMTIKKVKGETKLVPIPMTLKLVASIDKARNIVLSIVKVIGRGERKELWETVLSEAIGKGYSVVSCDTNAKFDCPMKIVHNQKDNEHPYESNIEGVFGQLKKRIYANMDEIEAMENDVDKIISLIVELAKMQFGDKVKTIVQEEVLIEAESEEEKQRLLQIIHQ